MADYVKFIQVEVKTDEGWKLTDKMPNNEGFSSFYLADEWAKKHYPEGSWRTINSILSLDMFARLRKTNGLKYH